MRSVWTGDRYGFEVSGHFSDPRRQEPQAFELPARHLATAVVKTIAGKSKNAQVHNFALGLDFEASGSSANLQYGSYVVVLCDDTANWDWDEYQWNRDTNAIESKSNSQSFPYNYMVFGVVPFDEPDTTALA